MFESDLPLNGYDIVAKSRHHYPNCYYFLFQTSAQQGFFGASPERLYQYENNTLKTEALAGSAPVNQDSITPPSHLLNDDKNIYENWLVVEDICEKLKCQNIETAVDELTVRTLPYIQHLVRTIHATSKTPIKSLAGLELLHPTAAVGGLPSSIAQTFIQTHQTFQREWFSGALGYFTYNTAECCVTIRSAYINNNTLSVFAGAGIVADSDPQLEWDEIAQKMKSVLELFNKFSEGTDFKLG